MPGPYSLNANQADSTKVYSAGAVAGTVLDVTTDAKHLIYSIDVFNNSAALAYLQVFDAQSGSVVLGTTAPTFVVPMPVTTVMAKPVIFPKPVRFSTGFSIACTTTRTGSTGGSADVIITYLAG